MAIAIVHTRTRLSVHSTRHAFLCQVQTFIYSLSELFCDAFGDSVNALPKSRKSGFLCSLLWDGVDRYTHVHLWCSAHIASRFRSSVFTLYSVAHHPEVRTSMVERTYHFETYQTHLGSSVPLSARCTHSCTSRRSQFRATSGLSRSRSDTPHLPESRTASLSPTSGSPTPCTDIVARDDGRREIRIRRRSLFVSTTWQDTHGKKKCNKICKMDKTPAFQ